MRFACGNQRDVTGLDRAGLSTTFNLELAFEDHGDLVLFVAQVSFERHPVAFLYSGRAHFQDGVLLGWQIKQ